MPKWDSHLRSNSLRGRSDLKACPHLLLMNKRSRLRKPSDRQASFALPPRARADPDYARLLPDASRTQHQSSGSSDSDATQRPSWSPGARAWQEEFRSLAVKSRRQSDISRRRYAMKTTLRQDRGGSVVKLSVRGRRPLHRRSLAERIDPFGAARVTTCGRDSWCAPARPHSGKPAFRKPSRS
jgi:hypothetical protein